jgi:dCTP deaminase
MMNALHVVYKVRAMGNPWDKWIPGVLNKKQISELAAIGLITGKAPLVIDNSSIDLSLSDEAFTMTKGSVKPSGAHPYSWFIENSGLAQRLPRSADATYTLRAKQTYVFKLQEKLQRGLVDAEIYGQATAKSSVGRVDVLARLILDGMDTYERFDPAGLSKQSGDVYLEVTPITFDVKVKPGVCLSQLRLFYGNPDNVKVGGRELFKTVLHGPGEADGSLSVNLTNEQVGGLPVAAFYAQPPGEPNRIRDAIPLWEGQEKPDPWKYWKFATTDDALRLKITQNFFYLLRSKERISVPRGVAIYCRASDETIGEMRIHYAGFAHPFFGTCRQDGQAGTPLIFEVRGHQVDVSLADGEKMANLTFYRMSEDSEPGDGTYENQKLQLSKFFGKWPDKLRRVDDDGTVEPA